MLSIVRRTGIGALLLIIMPIVVWISGWKWRPGLPEGWVRLLYWITESVSQPWGIITQLILSIWFLWCLRLRRRAAVMLWGILTAAILLGQGIQLWVKERVQEPRPFVNWLEEAKEIPVEQFYALKNKERAKLVHERLVQEAEIPAFLRQHWQKNSSFAFPSGHTMFVASWALLGVGLLWPRRRWWTISALLAWAMAVMGSRLVLGMHWPQDLIAAALISWPLAALAAWLTQRLCGPLTSADENEIRTIKRG